MDAQELPPKVDIEHKIEKCGDRKPLPRKIKLLTASAIFYGNVAFGCAFNTYGPALTSLQNKYETDDATISRVFNVLTGSFMVGALMGGVIYDYVNRQFAATVLLGIMASLMFVTPYCPSITMFFITAALMGLCCGAYDTAQFVWIMEMMQKDCPPYVQSQHFFYAVGADLASFIMAPFLDKNANGLLGKKIVGDTSELFIPYTIVSVMIFASMASQILLYIFSRYYAPPAEEDCDNDFANEGNNGSKVGSVNSSRWPWGKLRLVLLSCCFYGAYQGMEWCTFQFFPKFGQNSNLNLSESESAYVLTGMQAAFAIGRGVAIIAVFKISTQLILWGNIIFIIAANVLLVAGALNSLPILWTSSILFGIGFSSVYPSFSAYIERYVNFTNFIGSLVIVCGSGVASIYPWLIGSFIENNPIVLSYTAFFSTGTMFVSFGILCFITFNNKTRYL